jgi:ribosomal protein S14
MSWWRYSAWVKRSSCLKALQLLQSFIDGELDPDSAQRVARHLEHCRRCGLEAAVYRELQESLRRQFRVPEPALAQLGYFVHSLETGRPQAGQKRTCD